LSTNLFDNQGNLLITPEEGCWYITTDTFELYVCFNGVLKATGQVKDFETRLKALETRTARIVKTYATFSALPLTGEVDSLYIVEEDNISYRWDVITTSYVPLGLDIQVINGGKA
jgi:hypothetical protein